MNDTPAPGASHPDTQSQWQALCQWIPELIQAMGRTGRIPGAARAQADQIEALEYARLVLDPGAHQIPVMDEETQLRHAGVLRDLRRREWDNAEACARGNQDKDTMLHNQRFAALGAALRVMGNPGAEIGAPRVSGRRPDLLGLARESGLLALIEEGAVDAVHEALERFVASLPTQRAHPQMDGAPNLGVGPGRR